MANLKDVQDIMKYIEEITSKLQYSSFEVALLIAERSELTHQEITSELVEKVQELSDSYDSLFNEALNEDLDEIFRKSEKQAIKITSVEELQKYIEGKGWVISDCSFNEDIDWEISKHSPAGEDFCFNIQCSNAVEDAINAIAEYTNSFDEEEHTRERDAEQDREVMERDPALARRTERAVEDRGVDLDGVFARQQRCDDRADDQSEHDRAAANQNGLVPGERIALGDVEERLFLIHPCCLPSRASSVRRPRACQSFWRRPRRRPDRRRERRCGRTAQAARRGLRRHTQRRRRAFSARSADYKWCRTC